jgi:predicted amidohydrolase
VWFRRKSKADPAGAARALRDQALTVEAKQLGLQSDGSSTWAVLMETGYPNGVATLAVFADGTTSLYFSSGGGIIGAGAHASVQEASAALLAAADAFRSFCTPMVATPYPNPGRVRFYLRTGEGTLGAEADEQELGYDRHPLSPLFHAAHRVLTAVRLTGEQRPS